MDQIMKEMQTFVLVFFLSLVLFVSMNDATRFSSMLSLEKWEVLALLHLLQLMVLVLLFRISSVRRSFIP